MTGIPRIREAGWFITGQDRDPVRHLFVRLEERMDGSVVWTVELHLCRPPHDHTGKAMREFPTEAGARTALHTIYALSRHLVEQPTWTAGRRERGRWRIWTIEPDRTWSRSTPASP